MESNGRASNFLGFLMKKFFFGFLMKKFLFGFLLKQFFFGFLMEKFLFGFLMKKFFFGFLMWSLCEKSLNFLFPGGWRTEVLDNCLER